MRWATGRGAPPPPMAMPATAAPMKEAAKKGKHAGLDNDADGIVDAVDKAEEGGEREEKSKEKPPAAADALRTNMAETAAWIPDVALSGGRGTFSFKAPERLTRWRVQDLAVGRAVDAGSGDDTLAAQNPLMVRVEIPRC